MKNRYLSLPLTLNLLFGRINPIVWASYFFFSIFFILIPLYEMYPKGVTYYQTKWLHTAFVEVGKKEVKFYEEKGASKNGHHRLVFKYSFLTERGQVFKGSYTTFNPVFKEKESFLIAYNKKNPRISRMVENEKDNFPLFESTFLSFASVIFLLFTFFFIFFRLRIFFQNRKLLLNGLVARGLLISDDEARNHSHKENGYALRLTYEFQTLSGEKHRAVEKSYQHPILLDYERKKPTRLHLDSYLESRHKKKVYHAEVIYLPDNPKKHRILALIPGLPHLTSSGRTF